MPYKTAGKIVRRAWFSPEEYKRLYTATRNNIESAYNKRHKRNAQQLHDIVLFMANTGLRPDEMMRLEYRDITIVDDLDSGETILEIEVRGKRGIGYCKSTANAVHTFERLVVWSNDTNLKRKIKSSPPCIGLCSIGFLKRKI